MTAQDADWDIVEPNASPIFEALRAFGYSPETAVADLVDNSISASAKNVYISFQWNNGDAYVVIKDDGNGMDATTLTSAMRLGSRNPVEDRSTGDLGRFGLGLKTASISQAREVTVATVSSEGAPISTRRWDLDEIMDTGQWRLRSSMPQQAIDDISFATTGTAVIWTKCDRLSGNGESNSSLTKTQFFRIAEKVSRHLSLTFHRFLEKKSGLKIRINGHLLEPWDPFLIEHPATWSSGAEQIPFKSGAITLTPFVLPHKSKMTDDEHKAAAGPSGWNAGQGFYVYRDNRLLVAGSWLGLGGAKEEHSKLARTALDIPVEFDHHWQVDVRKSHVRAPGTLTNDLQRVARATKARAQEVYRFRGKVSAQRGSQEFIHAWQSFKDRDGNLSFRINRKNPFIEQAMAAAPEAKKTLERVLRWVEETVPVTQIAIQVADGIDSAHTPFSEKSSEIREFLSFLFGRLIDSGLEPEEAINRLAVTEPFSSHPSVVEAFRESIVSK